MVGRDDDCETTFGDNGNDRDGAIVSCDVTAYRRRKRGEWCTLGPGEQVGVRPSVEFFLMLTSLRAVCPH